MTRKKSLPISAKYSENPRQTRTKYSYTMGGLPPGASALVYDKLYQIEVNNEYRGVAVASCLIDSDGYLRLENLKDSIYSVEFQNIDHIVYNFEFQVGNPEEFTNLVYHEIPYPVILAMTTGLDGSNNAYVSLTWGLDAHNIDGFYEIWLASGISDYYLATTVKNTRARNYIVSSVGYGTWYYAKIRTLNEDGMSRGYSSIVSGITPVSPVVSGSYIPDTLAPTGMYMLL
jgi:hypothetical protein